MGESNIMYIQPCFIRKNTPELREKLKGITGTNRWLFSIRKGYGNVIVHAKTHDSTEGGKIDFTDDYIDCGTNEDLFLALAALRDDTDVNQWFTNGNTWKNCMLHKADLDSWNREFGFGTTFVHKATTQELINHFKK